MNIRPLPHEKPDFSQFDQFVYETAALARCHIDLIQTFAEIGDHAGLEYAVRRLIASTRAIAGATKDLRDMKAEKEFAE
jgi:hypothetical protein